MWQFYCSDVALSYLGRFLSFVCDEHVLLVPDVSFQRNIKRSNEMCLYTQHKCHKVNVDSKENFIENINMEISDFEARLKS